MNRNDMRALVRLVVVSMAAYIGMSQLTTLLYMSITLATYREGEALPQLIPLIVSIGALIAAVLLMLWRSDRIAQWLMRPMDCETDSTSARASGLLLPAAFRIACLLGGFVFLYRLITRGVPMLFYFVGQSWGLSFGQYWRSEWDTLAVWLVMLVVGVYLLYGAPRFVRWHVQKTLEMCGERPDNGPVE